MARREILEYIVSKAPKRWETGDTGAGTEERAVEGVLLLAVTVAVVKGRADVGGGGPPEALVVGRADTGTLEFIVSVVTAMLSTVAVVAVVVTG